jgi:hypothetical protein
MGCQSSRSHSSPLALFQVPSTQAHQCRQMHLGAIVEDREAGQPLFSVVGVWVGRIGRIDFQFNPA